MFNLGPSHQCFIHHQGSVLPSIPKIGRLAGAATKSLLEGEIKRKIAGKEFFPENLDIFQSKKNTFLGFFFLVSTSFIHSHVESGLIISVTQHFLVHVRIQEVRHENSK